MSDTEYAILIGGPYHGREQIIRTGSVFRPGGDHILDHAEYTRREIRYFRGPLVVEGVVWVWNGEDFDHDKTAIRALKLLTERAVAQHDRRSKEEP